MDMLPFRKISCITFSNSSFVRVLRRTNSFENKTTVYITKFVSYFNYLNIIFLLIDYYTLIVVIYTLMAQQLNSISL